MRYSVIFLSLVLISCSYDGEEFKNVYERLLPPPCQSHESLCEDKTCADLQNDPHNCGSCKFVCVEDARCEEGKCFKRCKKNESLNERGACYCPAMVSSSDTDEEKAKDEKASSSPVYNTKEHCGGCGNNCGEGIPCTKTGNSYRCVCENTTLVSCFGSGCSINLQNDPEHCGECGNNCSALPNAENGTCSEGHCDLQCDTNYGNCDNNVANGCETDVTKSAQHCGTCGNNCNNNILNATGASCANSQCQYDICNSNFGDCDGDRLNGCETDLKTLENCGACGNNCQKNILNASGVSCANSQCQYDICNSKHGDCDNNRSNGCETDLRTASEHCGRCKHNCWEKLLHVHQKVNNISCSDGKCDYIQCLNDYGDCDNNRLNGCETNLLSVFYHCGQCNNNCNTKIQHASGLSCENGQCHYTSCQNNYNDCDGERSNGCETDVTKSAQHCGTCNHGCEMKVSNAMDIYCADGKCNYTKCRNGFGDCDGDRSNGCETDVTTSAQHCGACAHNCNDKVSNAMDIYCADGKCNYQECQDGYDDCDGDRSNGCETNLRFDHNCKNCSDDNNCSRYWNAPNSSGSTCKDGSCKLDCINFHKDCDGLFWNGCETILLAGRDCN